jgi:hypothetical protein
MQINPTAQRTLADRPSMPEAYRLVLAVFQEATSCIPLMSAPHLSYEMKTSQTFTAHQHTLPLNNGVVGSSSAAAYMVTSSETTGAQNV